MVRYICQRHFADIAHNVILKWGEDVCLKIFLGGLSCKKTPRLTVATFFSPTPRKYFIRHTSLTLFKNGVEDCCVTNGRVLSIICPINTPFCRFVHLRQTCRCHRRLPRRCLCRMCCSLWLSMLCRPLKSPFCRFVHLRQTCRWHR